MGSRSWWTRQKHAVSKSFKAIGHEIKADVVGIYKEAKAVGMSLVDKATKPLNVFDNIPLILGAGVLMVIFLPRLLDSAANAQQHIAR